MIRNLKYNQFGTIDMEFEHPVFGWIPYTANKDDVEPLGRKLHEAALSGEYGTIEPYSDEQQNN